MDRIVLSEVYEACFRVSNGSLVRASLCLTLGLQVSLRADLVQEFKDYLENRPSIGAIEFEQSAGENKAIEVSARWRPDAHFVIMKPVGMDDLTDIDFSGAYKTNFWTIKHGDLIYSPRIDLTEQGAIDNSNAVIKGVSSGLSNLNAVLNCGIYAVRPGSVRWENNRLVCETHFGEKIYGELEVRDSIPARLKCEYGRGGETFRGTDFNFQSVITFQFSDPASNDVGFPDAIVIHDTFGSAPPQKTMEVAIREIQIGGSDDSIESFDPTQFLGPNGARYTAFMQSTSADSRQLERDPYTKDLVITPNASEVQAARTELLKRQQSSWAKWFSRGLWILLLGAPILAYFFRRSSESSRK